jgi:hypothetical protein
MERPKVGDVMKEYGIRYRLVPCLPCEQKGIVRISDEPLAWRNCTYCDGRGTYWYELPPKPKIAAARAREV